MPKGNLLQQYHPKCMTKVVSNLDSLASGICQKPLLASNLENTVSPARKAKVSFTLERGWTFRRTFSFSFF